MKLDIDSFGFPTSNHPTATTISFTQAKLCWASVTVGRPNKKAVKAYAGYSAYEAKFRWNMVQAAIDVSTHTGDLKNSPLFNALDPTEKGGVNYFLGMVFLKLVAEMTLDVPWLVHYSYMKKRGSLNKLSGKSSPDFVGQQAGSLKWHIFEAKARTIDDPFAALSYAKKQANRNILVDGNSCELKVGSVLYREGADKFLRFSWEDPVTDEEPVVDLTADKDTWSRYYANAWNLADLQAESSERFLEEFGFNIELDEPVHRLRANINDKALEDSIDDLRAKATLRSRLSEGEVADPDAWNGDGIRILRVRERRQFGVEG